MIIEFDLLLKDKDIKNILEKDIIWIIDSREKSNQHIIDFCYHNDINYEIRGLKYGDYSFKLKSNQFWDKEITFENKFIIERKASLEELSNNFAEGRTRFETELAEIYDLGIRKIPLIIEKGSFLDINEGNYNTEYNKNAFLGSFISFMLRYNLQPLFIQDKDSTGKTIYNLIKYFLRDYLKYGK